MAGYNDVEPKTETDEEQTQSGIGDETKETEQEVLPPDTTMTVTASRGIETKIVVRISQLSGAAKRAVITEETYTRGLDLIATIKALKAKIEETRKSMTEPINTILKAINSRFKTIVAPLEEAEKTIGDKMTAYAREKADRERREKAELAAKQEAAALEVAAAQEAVGDADAANQTLVTAEKASTKIMADAGKAKVRGESTSATGGLRKIWKYRVTDIAALATARPDLVEVKAGDFRNVMNELIRNESIKADSLPGIEFYQEEDFHVR